MKIIKKVFLYRIKLFLLKFPFFALIYQALILKNTYGFGKSISQKKPVDAEGQILPWFTYSAIEWLNQYDFSDKNIFEYGSGYSTIHWSKRVKTITSLENDEKWYNEIKKNMPSNVNLVLKQDDDDFYNYLKSSNNKYDVIVIDSGWDSGRSIRENLVELAVEKLAENGLIIFDDTDFASREGFKRKELRRGACKFLRDKGLIQIDFSGFRPMNVGLFCTSIFVTRKFDFPILNLFQPNLKWK